MDKKFFIGVFVGIAGILIFQKLKKQPCGCKDVTTAISNTTMGANLGSSKESIMAGEEMDCAQAVELVIQKKLQTVRMTQEGVENLRASEMEKCQNA